MKHNIYLFLFLFLSLSCSDLTDSGENFTITYEDHETTQYQFPQGFYYNYSSNDKNSSSFDEAAVLKELNNRGVQMKDAWFKHYSSSCTPPGSSISMMVIVPGELLIRLEQPDDRILSYGFAQTSDPNISSCAYSVKHYVFID